MATSGPMMSCTSPPEQKLPPLAGTPPRRRLGIAQLAKGVAQLRIGLEGEGFLRSGRSSWTRATLPSTCQRKCLGRKPAILSFPSLPIAAKGFQHRRELPRVALGDVGQQFADPSFVLPPPWCETLSLRPR